MKRLILIFFMMTLVYNSNGQNSFKQNTIYFELGGDGLFASANYERQVFKKPGIGFHIGAGIYEFKPSYLTVPFGVNYILKLKNPNSYIDFGFGVTYSKADVKLYIIVDNKNPGSPKSGYWNYIPGMGYRRVTKTNLMYRLSLSPVINHNDLIPFFGFSFGKSFS
jgi:hypothetical protein